MMLTQLYCAVVLVCLSVPQALATLPAPLTVIAQVAQSATRAVWSPPRASAGQTMEVMPASCWARAWTSAQPSSDLSTLSTRPCQSATVLLTSAVQVRRPRKDTCMLSLATGVLQTANQPPYLADTCQMSETGFRRQGHKCFSLCCVGKPQKSRSQVLRQV